jgi:hypothetical protein
LRIFERSGCGRCHIGISREELGLARAVADKLRAEQNLRLAERIDRFERYTQPHSELMGRLAAELAKRFGLDEFDSEAVAEAALLHDIGLYAMSPDYVASPGPLTREQRFDLWRHPIVGEHQMMRRDAPRATQLLVRWHHEWWDGTGYPDGLSFEDIPIGARILRAVELYCALISDRPYRPAMSEDEARKELAASAGIECDPHVVKALLALLEGSAGDRATTSWKRTRYNRKSALGFQVSVLRRIEFDSVAIAFCGWAQLETYLKAWGKRIFSNDPRAWAATAARAALESERPLSQQEISFLLEDAYVPRPSMANPGLRRWFSESDAWWMDNLRQRIDSIDEAARAQALVLGLRTGDYALSFDQDTAELKRPLSAVFCWLAERAHLFGPTKSARSFNLPAEDFIMQARADLLYLDLQPAHAERAGSEARSVWRETWVRNIDSGDELYVNHQSKQSYLDSINRILDAAEHFEKWAIAYQEAGLASVRDVSDLIKGRRQIEAIYSKDLTELVGGLRHYLIVAAR